MRRGRLRLRLRLELAVSAALLHVVVSIDAEAHNGRSGPKNKTTKRQKVPPTPPFCLTFFYWKSLARFRARYTPGGSADAVAGDWDGRGGGGGGHNAHAHWPFFRRRAPLCAAKIAQSILKPVSKCLTSVGRTIWGKLFLISI